ncbi:MAG: response regulator [Nostoc desertorum CM1-VF14]|jgi:CheY-like chemotaxis protein|nr:response regulator [Nostoc desertorum CM1-VF14]
MNNSCFSNNPDNEDLEDNIIDLDIFKGLTILAVDNDSSILFLITEIFETYGVKVITADNALKAFEVIEQHKLDLLISDITMPGESGHWLIRKVRTLTSLTTREIPAIAFTGNTEAKADKEAIASGFQTFIQKPWINELVIETTKLLKHYTKISYPGI